jgi:hypothetical protein
MQEDLINFLGGLDTSWISDSIRKELLSGASPSDETYSQLHEQINSENLMLTDFQKLFKMLEKVPKMKKESPKSPENPNKKRKITMETTDSIYSLLNAENVDLQGFISLLNLLIHIRDENTDNEDLQMFPVLAARIYLLLLQIQDSKCYKIFNEFTFMNALTLCKTFSSKNILTSTCENFFDQLGDLLDVYSFKNHEDLFLFIIETLSDLKDYKILQICLNEIHGDLNVIYSNILQQIFKTLNEKKSAGYAIEFIE